MTIRRYTKADIPEMIKLLKVGLSGFHYGKIHYAESKVSDLLNGNLRNPQFFCHLLLTDKGEIAGCLAAYLTEFAFSYEVYASPQITYIREGYSSLSGLTGLVTAYKQWAIRMGAREIHWGQSTGYKMEKFAVLAKRYGFSQIGTTWMMETSR